MSESGEDINAPINNGGGSNKSNYFNGNENDDAVAIAIIQKSEDASNNNNNSITMIPSSGRNSHSSQFDKRKGRRGSSLSLSAVGSYENRKRAYLESVTSLKDLPSCEFRQSIRSSAILKDCDGNVDRIAAASTTDTTSCGTISGWLHTTFTFTTKGGTAFDGFLLAASQEVGQVILTLPWVFSLVGMTSGIILQIIFATAALYTNYLLVNLHTEFRKRLAADKDDPR